MKKVMFHHSFFGPEVWSGITEHIRLLWAHLQGKNYDFAIIRRDEDGPQPPDVAERAGVRNAALSVRSDEGPWAQVLGLAALLRRERVDILHLHGPCVGGQLALVLAARIAGVGRVVATYHLVQTQRLPSRSRLVARTVHQFMVDQVIAVSQDVSRSLTEQAGIPAERIVTIANGVDDHECSPLRPPLRRHSGEFVLGAFGRLAYEKNQAVLLRVMALLVSHRAQIRMVLVGDGPDRSMLEDLAKNLGIADRVDFLGFRSDVRDVMAEVDLVIHAPMHEGMPLVLLEAMAAARPLVVNDAPGGLREVVTDGVNGVVVASSDPKMLADAVLTLIDDRSRRERMGQAGRLRWARNYSANAMAAAVASIYEGQRSHSDERPGARGRRWASLVSLYRARRRANVPRNRTALGKTIRSPVGFTAPTPCSAKPP